MIELVKTHLNITYDVFLKYINKQYQILKYKTSRILLKTREDKNKQGWR